MTCEFWECVIKHIPVQTNSDVTPLKWSLVQWLMSHHDQVVVLSLSYVCRTLVVTVSAVAVHHESLQQ